jgi:hypothetical protein
VPRLPHSLTAPCRCPSVLASRAYDARGIARPDPGVAGIPRGRGGRRRDRRRRSAPTPRALRSSPAITSRRPPRPRPSSSLWSAGRCTGTVRPRVGCRRGRPVGRPRPLVRPPPGNRDRRSTPIWKPAADPTTTGGVVALASGSASPASTDAGRGARARLR